jgi:tetratricopeptide (TPR) repeat protein
MRRLFFCLAAVVVALGAADASFALSATALFAVLHNCENDKLGPDARISACTQVIHSNLLSAGVLTAIYNNRGTAYEAKGDQESAMQDYSKALELKPDNPEALANRARLSDQRGNR